MARKRRRSGSAAAAGAGASGCGPFGFFLALCVIGLIVQYWWVLLIGFGVVTLTVVLVRRAKAPAPPTTARQAKTIRTPEARVTEDFAAQMRANKHVRHVRAMQEWDYEWIRLPYPEKSSREVSEIANAFFARGWSAGVSPTDTPPSPRGNDPGPATSTRENGR